jgi:cardiolipin synthase
LKKKKYLPCGELKLVHGGNEFFMMLRQLIDAARESIHLHTYIFNDDKTGTQVAESLILAAGKGVEVYVLVDGYGSQRLPPEFIDRLKKSGIHFRFFEPLFKSSHFYFGRRLHHKIVVADEQRAIICGTNIADRYNDLPDQRAWLDLGLMVTGETAKEISRICNEVWHKQKRFSLKSDNIGKLPGVKDNTCGLRICRNDWVMGKHEIYKSYYELFRNATRSITVMCSYFLPGAALRKKLRLAAKRGVKVKIVFAGQSDIATVKWAERYLYRWLHRNNIEVYEYQPTVLHAKLGIADGEILTIGSFNVNDLSANASIELNLEVKSKEFGQVVFGEVENIIQKDCIQIYPQNRPNIFRSFIQFLSYHMILFLLKVATFYFKKLE